MSALDAALKKHGSAVEATLAESFEGWPIWESMQLLALLARELAAAERRRAYRPSAKEILEANSNYGLTARELEDRHRVRKPKKRSDVKKDR